MPSLQSTLDRLVCTWCSFREGRMSAGSASAMGAAASPKMRAGGIPMAYRFPKCARSRREGRRDGLTGEPQLPSRQELQELGRWKSPGDLGSPGQARYVDWRVAAGRIETTRPGECGEVRTFSSPRGAGTTTSEARWSSNSSAPRPGLEPGTCGLTVCRV